MNASEKLPGTCREAWWARPPLAMAVLAAFTALLLASVHDSSLTFDELAHAAGGRVAWSRQDFRLQPENGPLPQYLAGMALKDFALPDDRSDVWREANAWGVGFTWFYEMGHDATAMAWRARVAAATLAVLLGLVVWAWSRQLFGAVGGVLSLVLYTLSPTVLANGALITSDLAAALFFTTSVWAIWAVLQRVSVARVVGCGVSVGLLFLSKTSAVLIVPGALLLLGVRLMARGERPKIGVLGLGVLGVGAISLVLVWGGYGFRYAAAPAQATGAAEFVMPWSELLPGDGPAVGATLPQRALAVVRAHRGMPEAWIYGAAFVLKHAEGRPAFLNGEVHTGGWWWYFPYTFAVKTPLLFLAVIGFAVAAAVVGRDRPSIRAAAWACAPLWIWVVGYAAVAMASNLNIGHRHLLPVYPAMFILCGAAGRWRSSRTAGRALLVCVGLMAAEVIARFPHYLAYFNGVVSPREAYRHLVDSSLDWGQDLPAVRRYLETHPPTEPVYFSYFGTASPEYHRVTARPLYSFFGQHLRKAPDFTLVRLPAESAAEQLRQFQKDQPAFEVMEAGEEGGEVVAAILKRPWALRLTGGTYLLSATMLQAVHFEEADGPRGRWRADYEKTYQTLSAAVKPLMSEDPAVRRAGLLRRPSGEWAWLLQRFEAFRFARLAAYLRGREPDDQIAFTVLVYRLSEAEMVRALDGPAPEN